MAAAMTSSTKTSPQRPKGLLDVTIIEARSYRLETSCENRFAPSASKGDAADFFDDDEWVSAQSSEYILGPAAVVGIGETGDPFGGGREQHSVTGLAGTNCQAGHQMGLAGAGRADGDRFLFRGDEVQGSQLQDEFSFHAGGMVEVGLLQALA